MSLAATVVSSQMPDAEPQALVTKKDEERNGARIDGEDRLGWT